jgi:hypothetical protein
MRPTRLDPVDRVDLMVALALTHIAAVLLGYLWAHA